MNNTLLKRLLGQNKRIVLPNFGAFIHKEDESGNSVIFSPYLRKDDGVVTEAITAEFGIEGDDAKDMIREYVSALKSSLATNGKYYIEGVGMLKVDANGAVELCDEQPQSAPSNESAQTEIQTGAKATQSGAAPQPVSVPQPQTTPMNPQPPVQPPVQPQMQQSMPQQPQAAPLSPPAQVHVPPAQAHVPPQPIQQQAVQTPQHPGFPPPVGQRPASSPYGSPIQGAQPPMVHRPSAMPYGAGMTQVPPSQQSAMPFGTAPVPPQPQSQQPQQPYSQQSQAAPQRPPQGFDPRTRAQQQAAPQRPPQQGGAPAAATNAQRRPQGPPPQHGGGQPPRGVRSGAPQRPPQGGAPAHQRPGVRQPYKPAAKADMWLVVAIIAALIVVGLMVYGIMNTQDNIEIPVSELQIEMADSVVVQDKLPAETPQSTPQK